MPDGQCQPWWQTITPEEQLTLRRGVVELLARSRLRNSPDLEDVAQEALMVLFKDPAAVNPANDGLLRYTFAVARNRLLDRQKRARAGGIPDDGMADPAGALDPGAREQHELISSFLYELDPLDRYILWRRVVDGRSVSSVAKEVGMYWHKAARRIEAALQRLHRRLSG